MEKLAIGLLKSNHNIQLKETFIEKLIQGEATNKPSPTYSPRHFINEIEDLWTIANNTSADLEKAKSNYASFQTHFGLIKKILSHFLDYEIRLKFHEFNGVELTEKEFPNLLIHFINLIKSTFSTCPGHTESISLKRERLLLLIAWLRLLTETFLVSLKDFELAANFINILSTLNLTLMESENLNASYFLYLIQNDSNFCEECLKFFSAFLSLVGHNVQCDLESSNETEDTTETAYKTLSQFLLKTLSETNSILIR